ncbi:MAG: hypothetical protein CMJ33_08655 [Phycisphaerae bacterium]|nr:hypothetical protein [Phycisphaerae bacterium]
MRNGWTSLRIDSLSSTIEGAPVRTDGKPHARTEADERRSVGVMRIIEGGTSGSRRSSPDYGPAAG